MAESSQALLVILVSMDGHEPWHVVKPEDVPEWLKAPEVIANLIAGEMAQNKAAPLAWYRAERIDSKGEKIQ